MSLIVIFLQTKLFLLQVISYNPQLEVIPFVRREFLLLEDVFIGYIPNTFRMRKKRVNTLEFFYCDVCFNDYSTGKASTRTFELGIIVENSFGYWIEGSVSDLFDWKKERVYTKNHCYWKLMIAFLKLAETRVNERWERILSSHSISSTFLFINAPFAFNSPFVKGTST